MTSGKLEVAVLGPLGTYTHEAAFKVFGSKVVYNERETVAGVFDVLSPSVPFGIVPQENTIFGTVVESYDLLRSTTTNFVRGEIVLKIDHCLIVQKGVRLHQIRKVMSHEQALGQCRDFLEQNIPSAVTVKTKSTAAAAREVANGPPDCAAICSSICPELFPGLEVLHKAIQNEKSNYTRFYIVAHSSHANLPHFLKVNYELKALLRITGRSTSTADCPSDILAHIMGHDIVISRIDRRPRVDSAPFASVYFMEIHATDLSDGSPEKFEAWIREVEYIVSSAGTSGKQICIAGIW